MAEPKNETVAQEQLNMDAGPPKLSELLDRGWKIFEEVDTTNEAIASSNIQVKVKRGISMLEEASRMVAQLALFSRNEEMEEIATADLKYLLLPALLGALTLKQTSQEKRLEIVQTARVYFMDFLRRCKEYSITRFELPKTDDKGTTAEGSENECSTAKVNQLASANT
ncbi:hypothetical protein LDENG_00168840 [Lucifuga dentata]|nr:hypothetical protein LDENG_00168840 [Lucifuga dentata]